MIPRFPAALLAPCVVVGVVALHSPAAAQAPSSASLGYQERMEQEKAASRD